MVDLLARAEKKCEIIFGRAITRWHRRHIDVKFVETKIRIDLKNDTTQ